VNFTRAPVRRFEFKGVGGGGGTLPGEILTGAGYLLYDGHC